MPNKEVPASWLKDNLSKACGLHFAFVAIFAIYTTASDATNLITKELVLNRWIIDVILLFGTGIIWYLAKHRTNYLAFYKGLFVALVSLDIILASFNVYTQRGMASRAVILFALPILISAFMLKASTVLMTAAASSLAYVLSAAKYFNDYFNEGYKAELIIEVGFYVSVLFIVAILASWLIKFENKKLAD